MKLLLSLCILFAGFLTLMQSCSNEETSNTSTKTETTTTVAETKTVKIDSSQAAVPKDSVALPVATQQVTADPVFSIVQTPEDANGNPHSSISITYGEKKTKVATITGNAEMIDKAEYKEKGIPADAIGACGGWWAGAGDYYYMIRKGTEIEVFKGWQEEEQQEKGYHWKKVKVAL